MEDTVLILRVGVVYPTYATSNWLLPSLTTLHKSSTPSNMVYDLLHSSSNGTLSASKLFFCHVMWCGVDHYICYKALRKSSCLYKGMCVHVQCLEIFPDIYGIVWWLHSLNVTPRMLHKNVP